MLGEILSGVQWCSKDEMLQKTKAFLLANVIVLYSSK